MKKGLCYICFIFALGVGLLNCKYHKQTQPASTASSSATGQSNGKPEKTKDLKDKGAVVAAEGLNLGNKAPEIEMADPSGNVLKLSSLSGKLVLIDFWASWCGPCRIENPTVVLAYNTYHNSNFVVGKGFEVFSVSLDNNKDKWINAIQKDQLTWPYHVCDMMLWNNAAALKYQVNSIPTNVLIDGNGIIIAKNLRGEDLIKKIGSLVK